jgi:hypothetical protein
MAVARQFYFTFSKAKQSKAVQLHTMVALGGRGDIAHNLLPVALLIRGFFNVKNILIGK